MKIAIAWDFLIDKGGAERELLVIARILNADIVTTHFLKNKTYEEFSKLHVISHPLKSYPIPLMMQREASKIFRRVDLSKYDIVISIGDWAKFVSMNKTLKSRHIHITISPPRMFYLKKSVTSELGIVKRLIFGIWTFFAARQDKEAMSKINEIIVQSSEAKRRVESYYNTTVYPDILYPPTETKKFRTGKSRGYFMSVQRVMPQKNIELQISTFNKISNVKLVIVGSVIESKLNYFSKLKKMANRNITFINNVDDKKLSELYSHATCIIQTSENEDFGLVPVEAMASGKPCIAVNEGGFRETITEKTGLLIDKPYAENLARAVESFDEKKFKKKDMLKRAEYFSDTVFAKKLKAIIGYDKR